MSDGAVTRAAFDEVLVALNIRDDECKRLLDENAALRTSLEVAEKYLTDEYALGIVRAALAVKP